MTDETHQMAREARNMLNLQILEVRALKNRTGCETIADFVLMFRELMQMEKIDSVKLLLKESLLSEKKTDEFYNFIMRVITYEDELIKLRKEFAEDKFMDAKFEQDQFHNYDEVVLDKISMENK